MTKLEEKLIELGYVQTHTNKKVSKFKGLCNSVIICIVYDKQLNDITGYIEDVYCNIKYQFQIDNIQKAFNQLQQDLKELKEYE